MKEPLPTGTQRAKADREHPSGVWVAPELFRSGVNGVLYREMAKLLRTEIQSGRLAAGTRLPSIEKMAQHFDVAIVTVRKALKTIENEGLIELRQGRGTFVTNNTADRIRIRLDSSWDDMLAMWEKSEVTLLKKRDKVSLPTLAPEDGKPAAAYYYMQRIHRWQRKSYALNELYIDRDLYNKNPKRFNTEMAVVVLESMPDVHIKNIRQNLIIGSADLEVAQHLDIELNAAVGHVRRIITDDNNRIIYFGTAIYRGDIVTVETNFRR